MADVKSSPFNLDEIRVAAPCSAEWAKMDGDERARHCALCRKNVYNLSNMTRAEAEALIREKEGKLCVRFFRRPDGTLLTANCPVGLRAVQRRMRWVAAAAVAAFAAVLAFLNVRSSQAAGMSMRQIQPFKALQNVQPVKAFVDWIEPVLATPMMGKMAPNRAMLGEICILPATPPQAPRTPPQAPAK